MLAGIYVIFLAFLHSIPNFVKLETTFEDLLEAQDLVSKHKIGWSLWDDSVIAMEMRHLEIDEIYSNDVDFDTIHGVKRIFKMLKI